MKKMIDKLMIILFNLIKILSEFFKKGDFYEKVS